MGLTMEQSCSIISVKCEPEEVILIDDTSHESIPEVMLKEELESGGIIEVKSGLHCLNEFDAPKWGIKQEGGVKEEENEDLQEELVDYNQRVERNLNNGNVSTPRIKFESKFEEVNKTDQEQQEFIINPYNSGYKSSCKEVPRSILSQTLYKCNECDYTTRLEDIFKIHKLNHTPRKHSNRSELDSKQNSDSRSGEKLFKSESGEKPFKSKSGEKPFKCFKCNFRADTNLILKRHLMLIHSGKNILECFTCGYKTCSKSHLRQHVRIHLPKRIKNFKCNACKSRFLYNSSLLKHMSVRPCKAGHT